MPHWRPSSRLRAELIAFAIGAALFLVGIALVQPPVPQAPDFAPYPAGAAAALQAPSEPRVDATAPGWLPAAANRLPERVRDRVIPPTFFGMHLLSIGIHRAWPDVPFGLYRTWDGVYRWHSMRPEPGTWFDWSLVQLDGIEELVAGRAEVMFTLAGGGPNGGFPEWLDPWATDRRAIHDEWRYYVRTVGERARGQVRYWEIWNEIDCTCFFHGPVDLLVELTDIAVVELKAIDPDNVVLSAVNSIPGSVLFDEYLRLGGAANVDAVSWHIDSPHIPEQDTTKLRVIRAQMAQHGAGHLPLWTTEGHAPSFHGASPDEDAGILARQHLVLWSHDSENFSWYAWDVWDYGVDEQNRPWIRITEEGRPDAKTPAGVAYGVLAEWLIGASMNTLVIDGPLWQIEIQRPGGYRGLIVWHAEGAPHRVPLPPGTRHARALDGSTTVISGDEYLSTTSPVLFER
jgi:hypothetical protein